MIKSERWLFYEKKKIFIVYTSLNHASYHIFNLHYIESGDHNPFTDEVVSVLSPAK